MIDVIQQHKGLYYWHFSDDTNWSQFHGQLDALQDLESTSDDPFCIVAFVGTQMPRGNAIAHLRRLIGMVRASDTILKFIVVNQSVNVIGQKMMQLSIDLFGNTDKLRIVKTEEEAIALVESVVGGSV